MSCLIIQIAVLLGCRLFISPDAGQERAGQNDQETNFLYEGYNAVLKYQDGFLAAGSGGRIDRISDSGVLTGSEEFPGEVFNCMLLYNQQILVAGDHGSIMFSTDHGVWRKMGSGTRNNIHSLAGFRGMVVAGADGGQLILGDMNTPFRMISLRIKGNIVSVSARAEACFGVTDEGEIIRSTDGVHWDIFDFNQVYSGYYGTCRFTRVLATKKQVVVAGVRDDGSAVLFFSHLGSVWTERLLSYTDDLGSPGFLTGIPNDILFDEPGDQFFLVCDGGMMMLLPSCTQCNELMVISPDDLKGVAENEDTVVITGGNFLIKTIQLR